MLPAYLLLVVRGQQPGEPSTEGPVRRMLLPEPGRPEATFREHELIYEAIAARNPERARREMAAHLDRVLRELQSFVAEHPGFFEQ